MIKICIIGLEDRRGEEEDRRMKKLSVYNLTFLENLLDNKLKDSLRMSSFRNTSIISQGNSVQSSHPFLRPKGTIVNRFNAFNHIN